MPDTDTQDINVSGIVEKFDNQYLDSLKQQKKELDTKKQELLNKHKEIMKQEENDRLAKEKRAREEQERRLSETQSDKTAAGDATAFIEILQMQIEILSLAITLKNDCENNIMQQLSAAAKQEVEKIKKASAKDINTYSSNMRQTISGIIKSADSEKQGEQASLIDDAKKCLDILVQYPKAANTLPSKIIYEIDHIVNRVCINATGKSREGEGDKKAESNNFSTLLEIRSVSEKYVSVKERLESLLKNIKFSSIWLQNNQHSIEKIAKQYKEIENAKYMLYEMQRLSEHDVANNAQAKEQITQAKEQITQAKKRITTLIKGLTQKQLNELNNLIENSTLDELSTKSNQRESEEVVRPSYFGAAYTERIEQIKSFKQSYPIAHALVAEISILLLPVRALGELAYISCTALKNYRSAYKASCKIKEELINTINNDLSTPHVKYMRDNH